MLIVYLLIRKKAPEQITYTAYASKNHLHHAITDVFENKLTIFPNENEMLPPINAF